MAIDSNINFVPTGLNPGTILNDYDIASTMLKLTTLKLHRNLE